MLVWKQEKFTIHFETGFDAGFVLRQHGRFRLIHRVGNRTTENDPTFEEVKKTAIRDLVYSYKSLLHTLTVEGEPLT